jgi:transaldolase
MKPNFSRFNIAIYADGANMKDILYFNSKKFIKGLTTNPTLMKKSGVKDYQKFALDVLKIVKKKPISFEVFSDDFKEMYRQAKIISSWGDNVFVKIPVTNTKGLSSYKLINKLSNEGIKLNVTAVLLQNQVINIVKSLSKKTRSIISIFAGRIADTGRDPIPLVKKSVLLTKKYKNIQILWASTRESLNIFQAQKINCDIITVTTDILSKVNIFGYDLKKYSLDTVKMFYNDAAKAGYKI